METKYFWLFLLIRNFTVTLASHEQKKRNSYFNDLKEELQKEWNEDNKECLMDLFHIIDGVQNSTLGAVWVWDSLQLPAGVLYGARYHLGSWSQCRRAPRLPHPSRLQPSSRLQYCLADVTLTELQPWRPRRHKDSAVAYNQTVNNYLRTLTPYLRPLNVVTWGACVPASCAPAAVRALLTLLLRRSALAAPPAAPAVALPACHIMEDTREPPLGYHLFWYTIISLAAIALFFTIKAKSNTENETETSSFLLNEVTKAFCINSNVYTLVKDIADDIPCLYGIRSITAMLVVCIHILLFGNDGAIINALDFDRDIHNHRYILSHTESIIDTFFFMSGLLTLKGLMSKRNELENVAVFILKRYVRYIGGLAVTVWYLTSVMQHMGNGPLWHHFVSREQQYCSKHWILNVLMVSNYLHVDKICHIATWYVSADFQLTLTSVALFHACAGGRRSGRVIVAIFAALALMLPAAATYWYRMPATLLPDCGDFLGMRKHHVFVNRYTRSQYRLGPYMVGMAVGFWFSLYKPAMHRNIINKRMSVLLLLLSIITMLSISSMAGIFQVRSYNVFEAMVYCATNRVIWSLSLGAVVIICEFGTLNCISSLLSWRAWVPLSRLSYGVYLTHPLLIYHYLFSVHAPLTYNIFILFINALGVSVLAFVLSLALWVLVEAPLINITNIIFRSSRYRQTAKKIKEH